jgi:hypothetical protein
MRNSLLKIQKTQRNHYLLRTEPWKYNKVAEIKDASRSPEEFMSSLSRNAEIIPQVLRYGR